MNASPQTVLIFEDNPSIQTILKIYFSKRGFNPIMTDSGAEAVELILANDPALVLMDIIMPEVDGLEACQNIRKAGLKVPIIILTSKSFASDRNRGSSAGADAYLIKPFNPTELDKVIRRFLP